MITASFGRGTPTSSAFASNEPNRFDGLLHV
jgi:hypothetical protein